MPSRVNVLGHSAHPMLVVFPLGLLLLVPVFDVARFSTGDPRFGVVAFWTLVAGVAGGLLAALPGLFDWMAIPSGTRAQRVGLVHMLVNGAGLGLYFASLIVRVLGVPGASSFVLGVLGFGALIIGGWLGGELVQRLGVGVAHDANLNAPSSLKTPRVAPPPVTPRPREPQPA
jgi:uncharacterized membrane protein